MAKLSAPNPGIFQTDPIEQVFARGATNRDNTAGLNAAWLLAFGKDRADNQDRYMGALDRTNAMDASVAMQEANLKLREQGMKSATDLIKEGFMPSSMRSGGDLFGDIGSGDSYAKMLQALTQSKINKNNQPAGGGGPKEKTTVETLYPGYTNPDGTAAVGGRRVVSVSGDPAAAVASNERAAAAIVKEIQAGRPITPQQKQILDDQIKVLRQQRVLQPD